MRTKQTKSSGIGRVAKLHPPPLLDFCILKNAIFSRTGTVQNKNATRQFNTQQSISVAVHAYTKIK